MGAVLRLVGHSNRETASILHELVGLAATEEVSLALCFRRRGGVERYVFTGAYKANPALGVNAGFRMSLLASDQQDDD